MAHILVRDLVKTFKVNKRQGGLANAFRGLVKREYTTVRALDEISFDIEEGELVGYLGPNGAGKSTTVKILSGILTPDSGNCQVLGKVPWKERVDHVGNIGVVFGQRTQLWWDLPVIDSFELLRDIYKVPYSEYEKTKNELVERLNLSDFINTPVRQLSLGQKMRCELAASLLHSPAILFLDEPTIGLDAVSKLAVRKFIKELNQEKKTTVILTTHDMDDIETLCSRVIVIGKGQILSDGSLNELRKRVSKERRLIIELENNGFNLSIKGVYLVKWEGNRAFINLDPEIISPAKLIATISNTYEIKDVFIENPPIEETIANLYEELKI
jgi:ABC-2 type transport system ATP-binding protein